MSEEQEQFLEKKEGAFSEAKSADELHAELTEAEPLWDIVNCVICEKVLRLNLTDLADIVTCVVCGAPYTIDTDKGVIDNSVHLRTAIKEEWLGITRDYWDDQHQNFSPTFAFHEGSLQNSATPSDVLNLRAWLQSRAKELPSEYATWTRDADHRFVTDEEA